MRDLALSGFPPAAFGCHGSCHNFPSALRPVAVIERPVFAAKYILGYSVRPLEYKTPALKVGDPF